MGEQSVPTVDQEWTGQVEMNGTPQVDTEDLAGIKTGPDLESTSTHPPSTSMPPLTRSKTARTHSSYNVAAVTNSFGQVNIRDESDEDIIDGIRSTPKSRKVASTLSKDRREAVHHVDPNDGRCFLTNRPKEVAVQVAHIVPVNTNLAMLKKLERVWGMKDDIFHLDTRHNLLFLRADWHIRFDSAQWILVPETHIIKEVENFYSGKTECSEINLTEKYRGREFNYYVVSVPSLHEDLCRYPNVNTGEHVTYSPPFTNLGPLRSHVSPHFVIFNTGKKLSGYKLSQTNRMQAALRQILQTNAEAFQPLEAIQDLYQKWMEAEVPDEGEVPSGSNYAPSEGAEDDVSKGESPSKRHGPRSGARSRGKDSQRSSRQYQGQQRANLPFQPPEDDSSSISDDTVFEDDTAWIDYIHSWQKQDKHIMEFGRPDALDLSSDEQLAAYIKEHARTPPQADAWDSWKPTWAGRKLQYLTTSDRWRFSSNDWAVFKRNVYLTRKHPRTIV